jgi:hypothetical protein
MELEGVIFCENDSFYSVNSNIAENQGLYKNLKN